MTGTCKNHFTNLFLDRWINSREIGLVWWFLSSKTSTFWWISFFNISICLFIVFTLNLSVILARLFPQTELSPPPPPPSAQVIEFVKSIGWYPYWILISFKGGFTEGVRTTRSDRMKFRLSEMQPKSGWLRLALQLIQNNTFSRSEGIDNKFIEALVHKLSSFYLPKPAYGSSTHVQYSRPDSSGQNLESDGV